jgi:hypothetical protein
MWHPSVAVAFLSATVGAVLVALVVNGYLQATSGSLSERD